MSISAFVALFCLMMPAPHAFAAEFRTEALEIHKAGGTVGRFTVELATDDDARRIGLMDRKQMKPDHGMLFDFGQSRNVYMWMKNTYLPLDMLFISSTGRVGHIHANATPMSEDIIDSRGEVRFVLEINAGVADKLGISVGDRIESGQISKAAGAQ